MIFKNSCFILTFSSKKYFGFTSLSILINSKNNEDLGSSKANCFPAKEKPWQGEPANTKSIFGNSDKSTLVTSPN